MVVDKDSNNRFPPHFLDSVEIAQGINLVESAVDPDTRARPPVADAALHRLALQLSPPALAPLFQEGLLVWILCSAAATVAVAVAAPGMRLHLAEAEDALAGAARPVLPLAPPGGLVCPGIRDDALDSRGAAGVEGRRRQLHGAGPCTAV